MSVSNQLKLKIRVKGYKVIKDPVEIEIDKTILYGPNGAGKTSVMEVLHTILTGSTDRLSLEAVHDDFEVEVMINEKRYELRREEARYVVITDSLGKLSHFDIKEAIPRLSSELHKYLQFKYVAWVDSCKAVFYRPLSKEELVMEFDACNGRIDFSQLRLSELRKLVEALNNLFYVGEIVYAKSESYTEGAAWWLYRGADHGWVRVSDLAYGHRRALLMVLAIILAETVFIESFEAALHADLAIDLIKLMSDEEFKGRFVVVETHHGGALSYAIALRKWKGYYMQDGRIVKKLSSVEDLRDAELYRREKEAYMVPEA